MRAVLTADTAAIEQCHQYAVDKSPTGGQGVGSWRKVDGPAARKRRTEMRGGHHLQAQPPLVRAVVG